VEAQTNITAASVVLSIAMRTVTFVTARRALPNCSMLERATPAVDGDEHAYAQLNRDASETEQRSLFDCA
jgi:hypothetical protein